jgi:lipoyl(octanoyl) transferase
VSTEFFDGRPTNHSLTAAWLGKVDYETAWEWQRNAFLARLDGDSDDSLMLLEHPPTYTLGRRSQPEDLIYGEVQRAAKGIALYKVDRGGRATYHGPGQLVGYPILALGRRYDVLAYLRNIEEVLIRTAKSLGVVALRDERHTGVWVGENKLAAIGVKITRGITMHGFALNVVTDLTMFEGIVPCGIDDHWVTSVEKETGARHSLKRVAELAANHFAEVFEIPLVWAHPKTLQAWSRASGSFDMPGTDQVGLGLGRD